MEGGVEPSTYYQKAMKLETGITGAIESLMKLSQMLKL